MIDDDTSADGGEYSSARRRALEAYEGAAGTLGQAPLIALAGGLAAGALIAALLPRTQAEARLVRPYARRAKDGAKAAVEAARETGKKRFDELGFSREKGRETLNNFLDGLKDTARASADAARDAAGNKA
jgi:hypothetical protein